MGQIQIMSRSLSDRIAAGEVIERPASVVKELVENAIDAGATQISVTIEGAGSRRIVVRDNGCGMDAEDARLAFETHGTSKLKTENDLQHIATLGFRGEAIPSIAAVSRICLKTRRADDEAGTLVRVSGGELLEQSAFAFAVGTAMEVCDLFYNVPARKKFLKSPATEEHHIEETLISLALGYPEIGFELKFGSRQSFRCAPKANLSFRVRELFGKNFAANLLPLSHQSGSLVIGGLTAVPGFTRPNRREQRVFINRRAVESPAIYRAIREGYATCRFEAGRFPPVLLFIDLPPEEMDVNVHPAKREVRFQAESKVIQAVSDAIKQALREGTRLSPPTPPENAVDDRFSGLSNESILDAAMVKYRPGVSAETDDLPLPAMAATNCVDAAVSASKSMPRDDFGFIRGGVIDDGMQLSEPEEPAFFPPRATLPETPVFTGNWPERVLGIFRDTYLLCDSAEGLLLVDQHAAHERIWFERLLDSVKAAPGAAQSLLLPKRLELSRSQITLLLNQRQVFEQLGFAFEEIGGTSILLSALPAHLPEICRAPEELFPDMLNDLLNESNGGKLTVDLEQTARSACHHAIKANYKLTLAEAENLLKELRNCRQGTMCPHGRPTMITLSEREIRKRFGRK